MMPKTIDQVTTDWLGNILGHTLSRIEPKQIGQGIGLMGDIYRVTVDYQHDDPHLPRSVVVKLPSSFEENRAQGVSLGMFDAEVRFYNELAPEATVGLPKIYRADIIPGTADFVIVMEDLSHLTMVNQSDGMSVDQARAAVKVLAAIHAVWWNRAQTPELEWIPSMISERIEMVDGMLVDILPIFGEGFYQFLPEGGAQLYEKFAGNYSKINATLAARSPWTLAHQDYRVENIMFGPDGSEEVVVLDWQGIGRGPGAYDLAYILGGSMDIDLRREHEQALVRVYHEQLLKSGISDYPFEQLWDDYGHAHLMGGLATSMVTGGTMDLSNERGLQLIATMSKRHVTAALDHDGHRRLDALLAAR